MAIKLPSIEDIKKSISKVSKTGLLGPIAQYQADPKYRETLKPVLSTTKSFFQPYANLLGTAGGTATLAGMNTVGLGGTKPAQRLEQALRPSVNTNYTTPRQITTTGAKATGKAMLGTALLSKGIPATFTPSGAIGLGSVGTLGGVFNKAGGGSFTQGFSHGVGNAPYISGFVGYSNPFISKALSKTPISRLNPANTSIGAEVTRRTTQGVANVAEGLAMDPAMGWKTTPGSMAFDFATGAVLPSQFQTQKGSTKNFRMSTETYKEIMTAEDKLKNPKKYIDKYMPKTFMTRRARKEAEKEAVKSVVKEALEIVERTSAYHLPNKYIDTLKTPQAKIKALVDLHYQNKLTVVPGLEFAEQKKTTQAKGVRPEEMGEAFYVDARGTILDVESHQLELYGRPELRVVTTPNELNIETKSGFLPEQIETLKRMFEKIKVKNPNAKIIADTPTGGGTFKNMDELLAISPTQASKGVGFEAEMEALNAPKKYPEIETDYAARNPQDTTPIKSSAEDEFEMTLAQIKELDDTPNNKFTGAIKSFLNPIANLGTESKGIIQKWRNKTLEGNVKANQVFNKFEEQFKGISGKEGLKYFDAIETGNTTGLKGADALRQHYELERQRAIDAGIDVGYLDNYLNHVWDNSMEEIIKARGLGKNLPRGRKIPTYNEGIKAGLTPKYTNPSQLAAHYTRAVDLAIANKQFVDDMVSSGKLLTRSQAQKAGAYNWKAVDAPFFPKAQTRVDANKTVVEDYVAPPELARSLNNMFEDKTGNVILNAAANLSKKVQDVSLSGGLPFTPLNAFSFANAIKDLQSGRIVAPLKALVVSTLGDKPAKNYFEQNSKYTKMMASEGIPSYSNMDFRNAYKKATTNKGFISTAKTVLGEKWDKMISEPTFKRFIPMLQVEFYKDTYEGLIKNGIKASEAQKVAANATKNFYGIADSFTRSKNADDALSAVFFAPRFREAMVNFWGKNLSAVRPKNWTNKEYRANQKYIAGTILTYGLMSALNKELTGHYPWQNKPGKELALEIPIGENEKGNERSWFIPLNPSIGTVPRRVIEAAGELAGGDIAGAASKAGTFFSQPVSVGNQLLTNRTFYGGPIYDKDDSALGKVGKLAGYGFEQVSHPYIGEPLAVAQDRKKPITAALNALELPFYESASTKTTSKKPLFKFGASEAKAEAGLPTNRNDLKVLYKDATNIISGYADNSSKIRTGLKTTQTLEEAQTELVEAQNLIRQMETENPEMVYKIGLEVYKSGGGKNVQERADWAEKWLNKVKDKDQFNSWYNGMLEAGVITKDVLEELRERGLNLNKYISGGKVKTYGGGGSAPKFPKLALPSSTAGSKTVNLQKYRLPEVKLKPIVAPRLRP